MERDLFVCYAAFVREIHALYCLQTPEHFINLLGQLEVLFPLVFKELASLARLSNGGQCARGRRWTSDAL
jgi:hypothetical protein